MSHLTAEDLETLFLEKLQEKYKLNERDLKKAFIAFDTNQNGLLEVDEIGGLVNQILNGVSPGQIQALLDRFDVNGDGQVSYEEFLAYLWERKDAIERSIGRRTIPSNRKGDDSRPNSRGYNQPQPAGRASGSGPHSGQGIGPYGDEEDDAMDNKDRGVSNRAVMHRRQRQPPQETGDRGKPYYAEDDEEDDDDDDYDDDDEDEEAYHEVDDRYRRGGGRGGPPQSQRRQQAWEDTSDAPSNRSDAPSAFDPNDPIALQSRCKSYLESLRLALSKKALRMRQDGSLPHSETITMQTTDIIHNVSRALLSKAFQPYTGVDSGRARQGAISLARVELGDFIKVLRSFQFPGMPPSRSEVLRYVFELCRTMDADLEQAVPRATNQQRGSGQVPSWDYNTAEAVPDANPAHLMELIFGDAARQESSKFTARARKTPMMVAAEAAGGGYSGGGGGNDGTSKGFAARANQHRREVGRGPLSGDNLVEYDMKSGGGGEGNMQRQRPSAIDAIPLRFVSRKTCTALAAPSDFDLSLLKRSAALPTVECVREYVFGMSQRSTGTPLYALPTPPSSSSAMMTPRGTGRSAAANTNVALVYASAALGVVHDVRTNKQRLFAGHDDDISCIALSNDGTLAATGCVGKQPVVHVWRTGSEPSDQYTSSQVRRSRVGENEAATIQRQQECPLVLSLGQGFFARSVCSVGFSGDDMYLAAVGCDDHHSMGIWAIPSGTMVVQIGCQNGLPPQILDLKWSPTQQFTEFISREHSGPCDLICTAGERHIRVWSFRRPVGAVGSGVRGVPPSSPVNASLVFRAPTMGKNATVTAAKVYTCCAFSPCADKSYDVIAGGSNGVVYLWRAGVLSAAAQAIKGGVLCLAVQSERVFCGGGKGIIKALDARTLAPIATFLAAAGPGLGPGLTPRGQGLGPGSGRGQDLAVRALEGEGDDDFGALFSSPRGNNNNGANRPKSATVGARGGSGGGNGGMGQRSGSANGKLVQGGASTGRPLSATAARPSSAAASGGSRGGSGGGALSADASSSSDASAANDVKGLVVVRGMGRSSSSQALSVMQSTYLIAATSSGRAVRIDVGAYLTPSGGGGGAVGTTPTSATQAAGHRRATPSDPSPAPVSSLFHYHTGSVWGLSTERRADIGGSLIGTVGEDRWLCIWDAADKTLVGRTKLASGAHCCHFDKYSNFIAVGMISGAVSVYSLSFSSTLTVTLKETAFRKDHKEGVSDIRFSPSNDRLAIGSHDNTIIIYACSLSALEENSKRGELGLGPTTYSCVLKPLHRLKGHSSYISHLDWSADSRLLRSNCGAYELLYWDAESGQRHFDSTAADVRWKTHTCVLGFPVMGIWPKYADGTDINAVDVCNELGIVATADDSGFLNVLNFPSVVKDAPRRTYSGHSSFVQNVRFLPSPHSASSSSVNRMGDRQMIATVGGDDCAVILWSCSNTRSEDERREQGRRADYATAL